jgi:AraC-like DNA-binding protein/ligand-binding sensor protein
MYRQGTVKKLNHPDGEKKLTSNIIQRREIEPLLLKAKKVIQAYEKATDTIVSVLDETGHRIPEMEPGSSEFFCALCGKYFRETNKKWGDSEYPCTGMRVAKTMGVRQSGGIYIYNCDLGFTFWLCPLSSSGRYAGSLIAGRVLGIPRQKSAEKISAMSNGQIQVDEAMALLSDVPEKTPEEIKSLAQLLLSCGEQISKRNDTYHEILKRRAKQQSVISTQIEKLKSQYPSAESVPLYPLDKERQLLSALRKGDHDTARKTLEELLGVLFFSNPDNFKFIQFRAIELVVLFSRAAVSMGTAEEILLEASNQYLKRIQDASNVEELVDVLHLAVERMTGQIFSFRGVRHASALRKAEHFIMENYTRKLSLQEVADKSGLSAPYFSTIFKEEMGENLSSYLNRLRVDRAAVLLMDTNISLSDIAGSCGFEDQSWFSKIFKNYTGVSPGKYRDQNRNMNRELSIDNMPVNYETLVERK